jgi:O-antigen/teichoic acid export membrane protein
MVINRMLQANKDRAIFITAYILTSLINYAFGVAMSWYLAPGEYGILGVAQSLLLLLALAAGSGFTWIIARDVAAHGVTDHTRFRFRAAILANIILGLVLSVILWVAYRVGWLPLGNSYLHIVPMLGVVTILLAARGVLNGTARGMYLFLPVAVNLVGEVAIKSGVGIALVRAGYGVDGIIWGFFAGTAVSLLHSLWVMRSAKLWRGSGWLDRTILRDTTPLFAGMLGIALMLNLDVLGLKLLASAAQGDLLAGTYQAAVILARTPVYFAQALTLVLFTYAASSRNSPRHDADERKFELLGSAIKTWLRLLLPASLVFILAPDAVLNLFFPDHYQLAKSALQMSAAGCALLALGTLINGVLQGGGERHKTSLSVIFATLTQIFALVWLIPKYGINGAAGSLLVSGITYVSALALSFRKEFSAAFSAWKLTRPNPFQVTSPYAVLAAGLILLPEGGRLVTLGIMSLVGIGYLLILALAGGSIEIQPGRDRVKFIFQRLVRELLGG